MKQNNVKTYVLSMAIPLLVGFIGSFGTSMGMDTYALLEKPMWTPPSTAFPIVWTILYILMGIGAARIYNSNHANSKTALIIYGLQLALNGIWSFLFFGAGLYFVSFLWILVLWFVVYAMVREFFAIDQTAALLQLPYLIWLTIAAALNFAIWFLNR